MILHKKNSLITLSLLVFTFLQALATPLPVDSTIRIGKLSNGLTYYVQNNNHPAGQANFYIAQKVGSILEEEHQRGLAHFLEHMCFNGTKHFPDNGIIQYLESIGVKFGTNVNAYTSLDQTVYNIDNVPLATKGALDSCLLILYDWSSSLTLDSVEIDKERGVIQEEWRSRRNAMMRMYDNSLPKLLNGSLYAHRMPIGLMSVINNFPYQALRDYYHKWYRPDLQGIVVIGDINVDEVENKIKTLFGTIPTPINPDKPYQIEVPDNVEPIISIEKDAEQKQLQASIYFKRDKLPKEDKGTENYYKNTLIEYFATTILNNRLGELLYQEEPPFLAAKASYGKFLIANTKDAFSVTFASTPEGFNLAFDTILEEIERAKQHGITDGELGRMLQNYENALENFYIEKDKITNKSLAQSCVNNFLYGSSLMSRQQDYDLSKRLLPTITTKDIHNQFIQWLADSHNVVIAAYCPDVENLPTSQSILEQFNSRTEKEIAPYKDTQPKGKLLDEDLLKTGKVVKSKKGKFNSTIWQLSNGARVILKPTQLKENQIRLTAISPGGTSLYKNDEFINLGLMSNVVSLGGLGDYDAVQLRKLLAGKSVNVRSTVATLREGLVGYSSSKDFETMLQLTYLRFTAPRKDSVAFNSYLKRLRIQLEGKEKDPSSAFSDSLMVAMYDHHPRAKSMKPKDIQNIDYDRCIEIYKERFDDASDFTFYIVGSFSPDSIKPYVEKYIGSLPTKHKREKYYDDKKYLRNGKYQNNFTRKMETPKSSVFGMYHAPIKATLKNDISMDMLIQILRMVYTQEVREKEGGTYSVSVKGGVVRMPKEQVHLQISFTTDTERYDYLSKLVLNLFSKLANEGPSPVMLEKVRQYILKSYEEEIIENNYWLNALTAYYWEDIDKHTKYKEIVEKITTKEIQQLAKKIEKSGNLLQVCMTGIEQ